MNRCEFESFAVVWIKYSFFYDTMQWSRWQRLKCPIRKKILDRWNDYVLWNRRDPNTSDAVTYPKRTNISCLRILSNNEFYALNLQVLVSEKYFEPIIFIDAMQEHLLNLPQLSCHSDDEYCLTKAICMAVAGATHICSFCLKRLFALDGCAIGRIHSTVMLSTRLSQTFRWNSFV